MVARSVRDAEAVGSSPITLTIIMTKFSKKSLIFSLAPLVAGGIFIFLCCINLTGSIWFDESYSAYLVRGDFADIWHLTAMDVHPPFYYFCLKIWTMLFGTTDFAMRFMSVFFGCVAIVFAFQCIKRWFGEKPAAVSVLLLSLCPIFLRYGQEMRMYTLIFAIIAAASFVLTLALDTNKKRYWLIYGVLVSLGMWTQYLTAIAWLAQLIYVIYRYGGIKKVLHEKYIVESYILAILLFVPWLPSFFVQLVTVQQGFWIPEPTLATIPGFLSETMVYTDADNTKSWFAILVAITYILLGFLIYKIYQKSSAATHKKYNFLLIMSLLPPFILFLLSLPPLSSVFYDRYLLYSAGFAWLLAGVVLSASRSGGTSRIGRLPQALFAITLVTSGVIGIINVESREPKGYVKEIFEDVAAVAKDGEAILASNEWIYYDAAFYSSEKHPVFMLGDATNYQYGSLEPIRTYKYNVPANYDDFIKDHKTFWYIYETASAGEHDPNKDISAGIKLPADNLRILTELKDEHHTALELTVEN